MYSIIIFLHNGQSMTSVNQWTNAELLSSELEDLQDRHPEFEYCIGTVMEEEYAKERQ